jgi:hypothetical protein
MNASVEPDDSIVLDAAIDAISRVRRILWIIASLICLGFFFQFMWYLSWEKARVVARHAVVERMRQLDSQGIFVSGSLKSDSVLARSLEREATSIDRASAEAKFTVPLINMGVSSSDFSIALLMVAAFVLLWLVAYQKRVNSCLQALARINGWKMVSSLFQYQFAFLGKNSSRTTRIGSKIVLFGLPVLALLFLLSDAADLFVFMRDPVRKLAFSSLSYVLMSATRIGLDALLSVAVIILGWRAFRAFRDCEEDLLRELPEDSIKVS